MNTMETYQSDAMERPIFRRRLFWALVISLLLHVGIVLWFRQTQLPQFNTAPAERLVPRIFKVKDITIDEKLLEGSDQEAKQAKQADKKPAVKPIDLPPDNPMADVSNGRMTPAAPVTEDIAKPIANDKPVVESNEAQAIARVQDSAKMVMEQDLKSLKDSLLKDQPAEVSHSHLVLPDSHDSDAIGSDAAQMQEASGRLDKLLGHGLHAGDAPVTLPGGALFEFAESDLRTASIEQLRKLGLLIKRNPEVRFSIEGYTDSFGDADYNRQLSQQRAEAVRTWLIQNMDVNPSHIQAIGYGATRLLVQPEPVDMHSQASIDREKLLEQPNRRVEIRFKFPSPR